jgi:hypothetical protein
MGLNEFAYDADGCRNLVRSPRLKTEPCGCVGSDARAVNDFACEFAACSRSAYQPDSGHCRRSESCHVWTAPSWQGLSSRRRTWSVQPCVRPLSAVRMTAGHNALRGSGPGHKPAFKDALAQVGCPDRRIDRLCITCCSSSQPSHHARYSARSRYGLSAIG